MRSVILLSSSFTILVFRFPFLVLSPLDIISEFRRFLYSSVEILFCSLSLWSLSPPKVACGGRFSMEW